MAFMVPEYSDEPFERFEHTSNGETEVAPIDCGAFDNDEEWQHLDTIAGKFWFRLTAPGYMDCTDWNGPYDTLEEARQRCTELYDVDPDTGDTLPEEE